ncbi:MAG: cation:proton antiporter subunit C [Oscillospiraceae bacterium]|nr:cation:proton antiporter subunit C [Oscillospiraceae bacterium]
MNFEIVELFSIILFFISFFGLITSKKALKSIVFTLLLQTAVVMFFLSIGFGENILPPIGEYVANPDYVHRVADPLPQALMLTAIIIGVSVSAINIVMLMTIFRKHKTTDWDIIKKENMG